MDLHENLVNYVFAADKLSNIVAQKADEGYQNLLIPSRGVVPFVEMVRMFDMHKNRKHTLATFTLPFTSDTFEIDGRAESVRKYWVGVFDDIVQQRQSKELAFYSNLLNLAGYVNPNHRVNAGQFSIRESVGDYLPKPAGTKTIFIDTVVSGRASSTILDEFAHRQMDVYSILLVDRAGDKLRSPYKERLQKHIEAGNAKMIFVDDLFTEDKGPAYLGMTAIVFPTLVEVARDYFGNYPGAGVCSRVPIKDIAFSKLNAPIINQRVKDRLGGGISEAVPLEKLTQFIGQHHARTASGFLNSAFFTSIMMLYNKDEERYIRAANQYYELFENAVKDHQLAMPQSTLSGYEPALERIKLRDIKATATSSHVISIECDKSDARRFLGEFERSFSKG